jgi:hypothetical protein
VGLKNVVRALTGSKKGAEPASEADDARRETALAEFSALRQEIGARSGVQHQLMALNITALAAIGGFVISDKASPLLLLMLPIVSPALGILWHDHARNIENIGTYIKDELKPILVETSGGDETLLSYEERIDEYERRRSSRFLPLAVPLFVLFAGFSIVALVFAFFAIVDEEAGSPQIWTVWALGVGMVLIYLWLWSSFVRAPYQVPSLAPNRLWRLGRTSLGELESLHGFYASDAATGLYSAFFGRDSLWVLLILIETTELHQSPSFAAWVQESAGRTLRSLCDTQGTRVNDAVEEQPGKIVHEFREELDQRLVDLEMPFERGRSYSGFDQTFLFVVAYASFARRFPSDALVQQAWPNVQRAVAWIETYADDDGDGLFEYRRRDPRNPINQVWKDSFDSAVVTGFDVPPGPLAWIEVQAYAFRALRDAADLFRGRGDRDRGQKLDDTATALRRRVFESFWLDDEDCFALALDGRKRPVPMITSNAAHALWAGLVDGDRAERLVRRLLRADVMTQYGLRTLSSNSPFFAPFTYHRGNVWPFDNAVFAIGLERMRRSEDARRVAESVCSAISRLQSAIELYVVLGGDLLVEPRLGTRAALAVRRRPPENQTQAFTAAALLYLGALLARARGVQLPDD